MLPGSRSEIRRVSESSSRALCLFTSPILRDGSSQVSQSASAARPDEQTPAPHAASICTWDNETSVDPIQSANPRRVVMSPMNRKRRAASQPLIGLTATPLTTVLLCTAAFMATGATAAAQAPDSIHLSYVTADLTGPEGA